MGLYKIFKVIAAIIGVLATVFFIMILAKGETEIKASGEGVDGPLIFGYIVLGFIALLVFIFALKGLFTGNIKKTLLTVAAFIVVVIIGYALADNTVYEEYLRNGDVTESDSKWVGVGLYAFYFIAIAAVTVTVLGGVKKLISK